MGYISRIDYLNNIIYHNPESGQLFDINEDEELLEQLLDIGYSPSEIKQDCSVLYMEL